MIKVRFFSDFCSGINCINVYKRILNVIKIEEYGIKIVFVDDDDYTHAIIINKAMPKLKCDKHNVLGLSFEPNPFLNINQDFIMYAQKYIGTYYIGSTQDLTEPFKIHHGFMWHCPFPKTISQKNKIMSIVFSNKRFAPGHIYRSNLVNAIMQTNLPVDIYGLGCCNLKMKDNRIKGQFDNCEPYDGYMYSIAIENYSLPGYYSEKYLNCLMYGTTPIYLGCPNVENDYPNHAIYLKGNIDNDLSIIKSIVEDPNKYVKQIDRYDVLKKHDIISHLLELWKD